ncbi:uncharacterized protein LOC134840307 isoform X2 [Symsagittifera roscoffensis]|uniref:uncharacterized protein LOC134840307 isoform X2 n=2 Tax=Symsagittifera roscoffensis TaxID=84072 RepID=UPI00307B170A
MPSSDMGDFCLMYRRYTIAPTWFCGLLSVIFVLAMIVIAIVALAKKYRRQPTSNMMLVLLTSCAFLLAVFLEASLLVLLFLENRLFGFWPLVVIGVCQLCEMETICVFLVLAVQRFISWKRPILFMNQSRKSIVAQFLGTLLMCHVLLLVPIVPILMHVPEQQWHDIYMKTETITQVISVLLSAASIGLQLYVSCHRRWQGEAMSDILASQPSPQIHFSTPSPHTPHSGASPPEKTLIVTMDEHIENSFDQHIRDSGANGQSAVGGGSVDRQVGAEEGVLRQSAIPRLMRIITVMTCILCSLMCLDIFLWADLYYREDFSCWHYLLSQISFLGFFFKFWMLPAALLFGCRSLRQEIDLCACIPSIFIFFKSPFISQRSHVTLTSDNKQSM